MLKSLGANVNLDMTRVVENQVRQMLAALKKEVQDTARQTGDVTAKMVKGLSESASQMEHIVSVTQKIGKGSALTETIKGYTEIGQQLTVVKKNAELASIRTAR